MPLSLFSFVARIERMAADARAKRQVAEIQRDPHLARDIGLPYRERPRGGTAPW